MTVVGNHLHPWRTGHRLRLWITLTITTTAHERDRKPLRWQTTDWAMGLEPAQRIEGLNGIVRCLVGCPTRGAPSSARIRTRARSTTTTELGDGANQSIRPLVGSDDHSDQQAPSDSAT